MINNERDVFPAMVDWPYSWLRSAGRDEGVPPDVEPGSDADIDRGADTPGNEAEQPDEDDKGGKAIPSGDGEQMDDNIDDLGRRPDGTEQAQPGISRH